MAKKEKNLQKEVKKRYLKSILDNLEKISMLQEYFRSENLVLDPKLNSFYENNRELIEAAKPYRDIILAVEPKTQIHGRQQPGQGSEKCFRLGNLILSESYNGKNAYIKLLYVESLEKQPWESISTASKREPGTTYDVIVGNVATVKTELANKKQSVSGPLTRLLNIFRGNNKSQKDELIDEGRVEKERYPGKKM